MLECTSKAEMRKRIISCMECRKRREQLGLVCRARQWTNDESSKHKSDYQNKGDRKTERIQKINEREQAWKEKRMHGQYTREMDKCADKDETCGWIKTSDLKAYTESLLCAARDQTLRTNCMTHRTDKTWHSPVSVVEKRKRLSAISWANRRCWPGDNTREGMISRQYPLGVVWRA